MDVSAWLTDIGDKIDSIVSLILFIVSVVVSFINFFRTGNLSKIAKKYIKGELETVKGYKKPAKAYQQEFSEVRDTYVLNTVTNVLEKSPLKEPVQEKIQSYASTCLGNVLDLLLNPDSYKDPENVKVVDDVALHNDVEEDLAYMGDVFEIAEGYREKFGLPDTLSVEEVFAKVGEYSKQLADKINAQAESQNKTVEKEVNENA